MTDNSYAQAYTDAFSKFVPGFDFLQGLVKNAGHTLPTMGQWIAPVLDPAELDKRIAELRTVQFWLEQNARMIGATIQAMEVQRMTLSALQGMNVSMADLSDALKVRVPGVFGAQMGEAAPASRAAASPAPAPAAAQVSPENDEDRPSVGAGGAVDPMQWWGALTQQFTQLATQAMQATGDAAQQASQAMQAAGAAAADVVAQAAPVAAAAAAAAVEPLSKGAEMAAQVVASNVKQAAEGPAKAAGASRTAAKKSAATKTTGKPVAKTAAKRSAPKAGG